MVLRSPSAAEGTASCLSKNYGVSCSQLKTLVRPAAEGKEFTSFKKVVRAAESGVPLVSMNSSSKGFFGECGHRGGYFEVSFKSPRALLNFVPSPSVSSAPPTTPICDSEAPHRPIKSKPQVFAPSRPRS